MRPLLIAAALCLFAAACERHAPQAASVVPSETESAAPAAVAAAPAKPSPFPQWLDLGHDRDGSVIYYHPASIVRAADKSTADIWIEVRHTSDQSYVVEDKTTRQTITFRRQRVQYRFDCNKNLYAFLEQRIMGAGPNEIVESRKFTVTPQAWREVRAGTLSGQSIGPACLADIKAP